jgi:HAD superfamily hydrolase (TIGR01549 family)
MALDEGHGDVVGLVVVPGGGDPKQVHFQGEHELINTVIFDVDGTLINTSKCTLVAMQKAIKQVTSQTYTLGELEFALGIPGKDSLVKLGFSNPPLLGQILAVWDKYEAESAHPDNIYEEILELLTALKEKKIVLGVVTSRTKKQLKRQDFNLLRKYFNFIISADDTNRHKPDQDPLNKFFEVSGGLKKDALYIGDSEYDFLCAKHSGVTFALGLWGANPAVKIDADIQLEKPSDILGILKGC